MCRILCNEPFNLTPEQIGNLTPYQARHLYFCRRNPETGVPIVDEVESDEEVEFSEEWMFREHWRLNGLRADLIDKLWRERAK